MSHFSAYKHIACHNHSVLAQVRAKQRATARRVKWRNKGVLDLLDINGEASVQVKTVRNMSNYLLYTIFHDKVHFSCIHCVVCSCFRPSPSHSHVFDSRSPDTHLCPHLLHLLCINALTHISHQPACTLHHDSFL